MPRDETAVVAGGTNVWGDTDGAARTARFNGPNALAADAAGNLFIAELGNNTVRRLASDGTVTTLAGLGYNAARGAVDGPASSARFEESLSLTATSDGTLYVADSSNRLIRKVAPNGVVSTQAGGENPYDFFAPLAAVTDPNGTLYVADYSSILVVSNTPIVIAGIRTMVGRNFFYPVALTCAANGDLFTADYNSSIKRVYRTSTRWDYEDYAGTPWSRGADDGIGSAARFNFPRGILAAPDGELFVADTDNHILRKIAADRTVTTIAGRASFIGSTDGPGTEARFNTPQGLARDALGNLYVADRYNHTVRKIAPDGTVTTVIGFAGVSGQIDGLSSDSRLYYPQSVAIDDAGNLYIASGSVIRKAQPTRAPVFTQQPLGSTIETGRNLTFSVAADSVPSPTFQWYLDDRALPGATAATLTLNNVGPADAGIYTVVATNPLGTATSQAAALTVTAAHPATNGGGGAPSTWTGIALTFLALLNGRQRIRGKRQQSSGLATVACQIQRHCPMTENESPLSGLYRRTIHPLRRYLARMLRNEAEAEDIAHDAYLRVRPAIEQQAAAKPEALLYTTARRLAINRLRRRAISPISGTEAPVDRTASTQPSVPQQVIARQELARLEAAIADLPPGCRTVLLLRKIDLLSHQEIADRLGITVSTVEKQHARALRLLRSALAESPAPTATAVTPEGAS